jgi:hypothetical protein
MIITDQQTKRIEQLINNELNNLQTIATHERFVEGV